MGRVLTAIIMVLALGLVILSAWRYGEGETLWAIYLLIGGGLSLISWGLMQVRDAIREAR